MKRALKIALILCLLVAALCVTAYAADEAGIYDLSTVMQNAYVNPENAEGKTFEPTATTIDGKATSVYVGAERIRVNIPTGDAKFALIILSSEDLTKTAPTSSNIGYIDQVVPESGKAEFEIYPNKMEKGNYYIFGATEGGALTLVATFKYNQPYILGDVDGDEYVTATDGLWALQNAAGNREFTATQILAGDVDKDTYITATDALWMIQAAAGNRTLS